MKFKSFDGREIAIDVRQCDYPLKSEQECKSKLQHRCGIELQKLFPRFSILEEFPLPQGGGLKLDFFLPQARIAVEVQGIQHYKRNSFFYKDDMHWHRAMANDRKKEAWCDLNEIILVYVDREEDVRERIQDILGKA